MARAPSTAEPHPGEPHRADPDSEDPARRAEPPAHGGHQGDVAPGDEPVDTQELLRGFKGYLIGLALAALLTVASFAVASTALIWTPAIPLALAALAIAQMGVHLVFFLHMGTGPDSTNNILALAFGILIVFLLLAGSLWIMANLNHAMMPMEEILRRQR